MIASVTPGVIPWSIVGCLVLLALVIMVAAARLARLFDAEPESAPEPFHAYSRADVCIFVKRRAPDMDPKVQSALVDEFMGAPDRPAYMDDDWRPFLEANWDRLAGRAVAPQVEAGRYLPPRDCQVLIIVDGEEVWADVEFTRHGAAYGWHFSDTEKPLDPEQVVDWREMPAGVRA